MDGLGEDSGAHGGGEGVARTTGEEITVSAGEMVKHEGITMESMEKLFKLHLRPIQADIGQTEEEEEGANPRSTLPGEEKET